MIQALDGPAALSDTECEHTSDPIRNTLQKARRRVAMALRRVRDAALLGLVLGMTQIADAQEQKFSDCPPAVRKTLQAESKGAKIETVTKEKDDDDQNVYWADAVVGGKNYAIGVLEDGTLSEMNLAVHEEELAFDRCPAAVKETFQAEAYGVKIETVSMDMKYGVLIYEAKIERRGKSYEIVVAEDGTLVEKVLVIDDDKIELVKCPTAVQTALKEHAKGGKFGEITRSTGVGHSTYEAEIKIKDKVYLIEVAESGYLISKSLEATEE
jgi:hypothetical protein